MDKLKQIQEQRNEHRRLRLNALIEEHCWGHNSILVKKAAQKGFDTLSASLVSQYSTGARPITDRTVHMIEDSMDLPGWFGSTADGPGMQECECSEETCGPHWEVLKDLADLLPEDADVWAAQIKAAATKARRLKADEGGMPKPPQVPPPKVGNGAKGKRSS